MLAIYEPCSHVANGLPHIDQVCEVDLEERALTALKLLSAYGLEKLLSIERLHNHYALLGDEVVVMQVVLPGAEVKVTPMSWDPSSMFPVSFAFHEGKVTSTAWMLRGVHTERIEARLHDVETALAAAVECLDALQEVGCGALGIAIRIDDVFDGPILSEGAHVMERTYSDRSQTLTVEPGVAPVKAVRTSWAVPLQEGGRPWTRSCDRYCEWGPFKGHVSIHQRS